MASLKLISETDVVDPAIAGDPLQRQMHLPLRQGYFPMGFAVEVLTNSEQVLTAAEASWGFWKHSNFAEPSLQMEIAVTGQGRGTSPPAPIYRGRRNIVSLVADAENYAVCDQNQGFAFAWLNEDALADAHYLRYHFLEGMVLTMLAARRVLPLHAACVERDGKGVLLCGNSGAGKSSLAFACARAGWNFVSDDASYLVRGGSGRVVVGNSQRLRLRPSARALFPEIDDWSVPSRFAAKPSVEIATSRLPFAKATVATVEHIVFLNRRHDGPACLTPFSKPTALAWAQQSLLALHGGAERCVDLEKLLDAKLHEMRYDRLEDGIACLEHLVSHE